MPLLTPAHIESLKKRAKENKERAEMEREKRRVTSNNKVGHRPRFPQQDSNNTKKP